MAHREEIWFRSGEVALHGILNYPKEAKGKLPAVLFAHGFASCKEEFNNFPDRLADEGYITLEFDFRGHGKSKGEKGFVDAVQHLEDITRAYETLRDHSLTDQKRIGAVGHSLGTAAVLRLMAIEPNLASACLFAPVGWLKQDLKPLEFIAYTIAYYLSRPAAKLMKRHIQLPYRVNYEDIFLNPQAAKEARAKKLLLDTISIENYRYVANIVDNREYARQVNNPVAVFVALGDQVVKPEHSREVYNRLASEKKKLITVKNSGHSLMGDYEQELVFVEMKKWFQETLI